MKIQKTELASKIKRIKNVIPKKSSHQALQGILVKDGYLIANNLEMTVKAKIEGAEGECFIIPLKALDLIDNLPNGEVEITGDDKNITIKADKITNKYKTVDPSMFPETKMPEGEEQEDIIAGEDLMKSIRRVSYAIPAVSTNPVMMSMCLQAKDGYLNVAGLDGHVLAWDKMPYSGNFELLIPKNTADKLLGLDIEGDVTIRHNKLGALFVTDEYEVYTRLTDGKYFQYERMSAPLPLHTAVTRKSFLDAMIRAKMCTDEQSPVRFEISADTLNIRITDYTTDYSETVMLQEKLDQDLVIGFNAKLVIDTLKAFDCENVGLQFSGTKAPMIVEAEDSDFKAVVLPVAIK